MIIFCFYYGDGLPVIEIKYVISELRLAAGNNIAADIDAAVCYFSLHCDMAFPPALDGRRYVVQFDVFFGHLLFVQYHKNLLRSSVFGRHFCTLAFISFACILRNLLHFTHIIS